MRLSIITVNYNNAEGLKRTLDSVAFQTYCEFEHIIVDGGSFDNSVDAIKEYARQVTGKSEEVKGKRVIWSSEPDKGIYDAMNKGIAKASGEYLYFLNGGDCLASPTALESMIKHLADGDIVIGRVYFSINGKRISTSPLLSEKDMSLYNMYLRGINHQSAFIKRELLVQNPYDVSVKLGADWKFFVQAIVLGGASVKFIDTIFADFDRSGLSADTQAIRKEREEILSTFIPERIARDYIAIEPHYYEVVRVEWLLRHPFWYLMYRGWTTLGRKLIK